MAELQRVGEDDSKGEIKGELLFTFNTHLENHFLSSAANTKCGQTHISAPLGVNFCLSFDS